MQTNIIWTGRLYHSIENCISTKLKSGNNIVSTIIGYYDSKIYKVEYSINTNRNWEIELVTIQTQMDNFFKIIILEKRDETWFLNDKPTKEFNLLYDIDISLTPFTNTLPINRLKLKEKEKQIIEVIYFDIFEQQVKPVKQVYTRYSKSIYTYENYDKSFKANIQIDEDGLVKNYPKLFKMAAKHKSKYRLQVKGK